MITVHALTLQMYFTLTANRQPIMDVLFFSMKGTYSQSRQPEQLQEAAEWGNATGWDNPTECYAG